MTEVNLQEFGRLQAEVQAQRRDLDRMATSLDQMAEAVEAMREQLAQAKGGWKTLVFIGGAAAAGGAVLSKLAFWWETTGPK